jgi:nucleoside-diphosphate-sugar epimerase
MKKILVTGGTGFIGSWVVKYLLEEGHTVRVTVRDKNRKDKIAHLEEIAKTASGTLEFWEADLLKEGSFIEAMEDCEIVYHLASPFMIGNVKDPYKKLIDPAVKGTQNVLNAVNETPTVKRVALTSSVVAICGDSIDIEATENNIFTEANWNTTSSAQHNPYPYSKVLAEKEAWKIHDAQDRWSLVVLNPGFVMGPSLTNASESPSLSFMLDILKGKQKMGVPHLEFSFVDVRDIAKAHILAAENAKAKGRHIIISEVTSFLEFCNLIGKQFGDKFALPKKELPKFLLYLVGWTQGISWKFVNSNVGIPIAFDNSKSKKELGMEYIPLAKTVEDNVNQLLEKGLI